MSRIEIIGLIGMPDIIANDNIGKLIIQNLKKNNITLKNGDIFVITQKIVSKSEKRVIDLNKVNSSRKATYLGKKLDKNPKEVQLILDESRNVIKSKNNILITETKHGLICANSGIDTSNVSQDSYSMLPKNSNKSAKKIQNYIAKSSGKTVAVIISDTFGRPFRRGQTDVAIGLSGLKPLKDYRGKTDKHGNDLKVTLIAIADELASAAELVKGKTNEIPVVLIRGYSYEKGNYTANSLIMSREENLFL